MLYQALSAGTWAHREFGGIDLQDKRLNRRAIQVACAMAEDPFGSIPKQNRHWKQIKGAYRLFDHDRVSFESVSQAHWQQTRMDCALEKVVLLIQDTTWLDYSHHPGNAGMGWHGPGVKNGSGLFLHSVLAVAPQEDGSGKVIAWLMVSFGPAQVSQGTRRLRIAVGNDAAPIASHFAGAMRSHASVLPRRA